MLKIRFLQILLKDTQGLKFNQNGKARVSQQNWIIEPLKPFVQKNHLPNLGNFDVHPTCKMLICYVPGKNCL